MTSPTKRCIALLKKEGAISQVVERWNAFAGVRQDLFGFADILAMTSKRELLAIQTTSGSAHASHRIKILNEPRALLWLKCGNRIEIWSWSKRGPRGCKKVWTVRRDEITIKDYRQ